MKYELISVGEPQARYKTKCSKDLATFLQANWPAGQWHRESVIVVALDRGNNIAGYSVLFQGGVHQCIIDPKVVFSFLLQLPTVVAFAIAHNHPSGNLEPSEADIRITKRLYESGKLLSIPLIDHVIMSQKGFYSFADNGQLLTL